MPRHGLDPRHLCGLSSGHWSRLEVALAGPVGARGSVQAGRVPEPHDVLGARRDRRMLVRGWSSLVSEPRVRCARIHTARSRLLTKCVRYALGKFTPLSEVVH